MKKIALTLLILVVTMTVQAEDYAYLTFETTDGAKASVAVEGLTLSISETTLTVGTQSFTLTNLSKMYFSTTDESTTGISEVMKADLNEATEIYDLSGKKIVNSKSSNSKLPRGVYVIKTKQGTFKLNVK